MWKNRASLVSEHMLGLHKLTAEPYYIKLKQIQYLLLHRLFPVVVEVSLNK